MNVMPLQPAAAPVPAADDAPVRGFSDCHAGIFSQLERFERLPSLAEAAAQAREIAAGLRKFFRDVVLVHHSEEEQELFPAVLASAVPGAERDEVAAMVQRLAHEHREVERRWRALDDALHDLARGRDAQVDGAAVDALVAAYRGHAGFEEASFLPLASRILGRKDNHMAALGLSLHARHVMPEVLRRYGTHL